MYVNREHGIKSPGRLVSYEYACVVIIEFRLGAFSDLAAASILFYASSNWAYVARVAMEVEISVSCLRMDLHSAFTFGYLRIN